MTIESAFFGTLTRDAEVKISKSGKQYARMNIRVDNGDSAQFINTTVFDTDAIAEADKLKKDARVYVEGRLTLDQWTAQDGSKRTGLSATVWHCRLSQIGRNKPKSEKQNGPQATGSAPKAAPFNDTIPFAPEVR